MAKSRTPDFSKFDDPSIKEAFPGGFTQRDEANALTAIAFRNGPIENLHAGRHSALLEDPGLSRITDDEMKEIMINASKKLCELLELRDREPDRYRSSIQRIGWMYCTRWNR